MRVVLYKPQYLRLILKIVDQIKSANLSIYLMKIFLFFSGRCCSTIWQKGFQWWITQWVKEFTKLRALCAYAPYVPTYIRASNYYMPTCLRASNYYVPTFLRSYLPYITTCLRAYVPMCLKLLRAYVPKFLSCLRALHVYMTLNFTCPLEALIP